MRTIIQDMTPLRRALAAQGVTVAQLALEVGRSYHHTWSVVNGHDRPGADLVVRIMELTGLGETDVLAPWKADIVTKAPVVAAGASGADIG